MELRNAQTDLNRAHSSTVVVIDGTVMVVPPGDSASSSIPSIGSTASTVAAS